MSGSGSLPLTRPLVFGIAVAGEAIASALVRRGFAVVVADDHPSPDKRARAESLEVDLVEAPSGEALRTLVTGCSAVLPSPGLPDHHPMFGVARDAGVPVLSELDLAGAWDTRPVLAVTGTNGKTTVTEMVTEMVRAGGHSAMSAGNNEMPLVSAIDDEAVEVFVVEASSFTLGHTRRFEPRASVWLNFAADHLDRHASMESYEHAKARLWAHLPPGSTAVANADDPVVMANLPVAVGPGSVRTVTFSLREQSGFHLRGEHLLTDTGEQLVQVDQLPRALPHDIANALAASATALAGGTPIEAVRSVLGGFEVPPHRVQLVAEQAGVRFYDDSKATAPHATLSALRGFDSVVLIAGGRNKGLDLGTLAEEIDRVRAVVAIGDAADEVRAVFEHRRRVAVASSMHEALAAAVAFACSGDAVLLSPGCASYDWYDSYAERGDAFQSAVRDHLRAGDPR